MPSNFAAVMITVVPAIPAWASEPLLMIVLGTLMMTASRLVFRAGKSVPAVQPEAARSIMILRPKREHATLRDKVTPIPPHEQVGVAS